MEIDPYSRLERISAEPKDFFEFFDPKDLEIRICDGCRKPTVWYHKELVWPKPFPVRPSDHMPESVKIPFTEAQRITFISPSAAAGLLRLSLERLCKEEGLTGKLVEMISELSVPPHVVQAAHAIRLVGNDAVHEGFIHYDEEATPELVIKMSELLNSIVDYTIGSKNVVASILATRESSR